MWGKRLIFLFIVAAFLVLFGCSSENESSSESDTGSSGDAEQTNVQANESEAVDLKVIGTLPITTYGTTALENFKEDVEGASSGNISVETFPAGQLYNDTDSVNVLPKGSVDIGIVQLDMWTGKSPLLGALYLPMMYDSHEHFYEAREAMASHFDSTLQEKANVKIVGWFNYSDQAIISTEPIKSIEDFNGLRLRGWGEYSAAFFEYAGASAVTMGAGEVYDAMSKGVIDGAMSAVTSHLQRKFYEVGDYLTNMSLEPVTPYVVLVNLDTWNSLSEEQQQIINEAATEVDLWSREQLTKNTNEALEELEGEGVNIETIEGENYKSIQDAVLPQLKERFISNTGEKGEELLQIVEDTREN